MDRKETIIVKIMWNQPKNSPKVSSITHPRKEFTLHIVNAMTDDANY